MNKEEALYEFIQGLRIAFNNSLAYPRNHPYFIKCVEEFKIKVDTLFNFLNPIKINITPESLFIDDRYWVKPLIYVELAQILHQRKIKGIELRLGLNTNELADLLSALALSPKDVVKNGGLGIILKKAATAHISVEELDYSTLLQAQGEEKSSDIWRYLFEGAVEERDADKINEIADNFLQGLKNINTKYIISDDALRQSLTSFLHYLKENNKDKFSKCSSELFNYLANSGYVASEEDIQALKVLFKDLNEKDFTDILWSQISKEGHSGPLALSLFSTFSEGVGPERIASSLLENVKVRLSLKSNPLLIKRIQDLLSSPDLQDISPVYRNTLVLLLKDISSREDFSFNPNELRINYCFILLNLLNQEKESVRADFLLTKLDKEWDFITKNKDYEYIKYLLQLINNKESEGIFSSQALSALKNRIADFIEDSVWYDQSNLALDYLSGVLGESYKGSQFYLDKMFKEEKLSVYGVKLFLKFFPAELDTFYAGIEAKRYDLGYLSRIIGMTAGLGSNWPLVILKHIYSFANEIIRGEILKAMQGLPEFDEKFLLTVLKGKQRALKIEALKALFRDEGARKDAFGILLKSGSPWGSRNKIILENMAIIEGLCLKESVEYLIPFTKMNFFWHAPLKNKALNIIESWK